MRTELINIGVIVAGALVAWIIAIPSQPALTRLAKILAVAVPVGILIADRVVWAFTERDLLDHATCAVMRSAPSCGEPGAINKIPAPGKGGLPLSGVLDESPHIAQESSASSNYSNNKPQTELQSKNFEHLAHEFHAKRGDTINILLVNGEDTSGKPMYAFVAVLGSNLAKFLEAQTKPPFYPSEYGTVLRSGSGNPSDVVIEDMERNYNYN